MIAPKRIEGGPIGAELLDGDGHGTSPAERVKRPADPASMFASVLCGADRGVDGRAAHQHAALFASPTGAVAMVPAPQLTRHGPRALRDSCEGQDLLAIGAGAGASAVVEHAPIPVLVARWSEFGTDVTDTILVPVDAWPESSRAVELAGRLAAAHGGTVTVLVAPARDAALQRAIAASRRVVLQATGAVPTVLGEPLPRERAIPAAAVATNASLMVLATGDGKQARWTTAQIADQLEASVLAIPPRGPAAAGPIAADARATVTPDRSPIGTGSLGGSVADAAATAATSSRNGRRPRVLIAGAGVAGLETLRRRTNRDCQQRSPPRRDEGTPGPWRVRHAERRGPASARGRRR